MTPIRGADRVTITVAPADDDDNYSDRAVITDPVERVVLGTRVTCTDIDTGDTETRVIENDYVVICDGDKYIDGFTVNTRPGTVVVTIKTRKD